MEKISYIEFESSKAVKDGFSSQLFFNDGWIINPLDPAKKYAMEDVYTEGRFCISSETIVCRIELPDGFKGFLIVPRYEEEGAIPFQFKKLIYKKRAELSTQ